MIAIVIGKESDSVTKTETEIEGGIMIAIRTEEGIVTARIRRKKTPAEIETTIRIGSTGLPNVSDQTQEKERINIGVVGHEAEGVSVPGNVGNRRGM